MDYDVPKLWTPAIIRASRLPESPAEARGIKSRQATIPMMFGMWGGARPTKLIGILQQMGLTSELQLCLDAGDADSYDGTSQVWTDLSGNGVNYNRGATSGAEASDPTFNGVSGGLSSAEYFSFDGADYFSPAAATTFDNGWTKENALLTIVAWVQAGALSGAVCSNLLNTTTPSMRLEFTATGQIQFVVRNDTAVVLTHSSTAVVTEDAWAFVAVSVDEAAAGTASFSNVNGTVATFDGSYASPSANDPGGSLFIGARANAAVILPATSRIGMFAALNAALTLAQVASIYNATRGRFGV